MDERMMCIKYNFLLLYNRIFYKKKNFLIWNQKFQKFASFKLNKHIKINL